jgi:hypothetical protein
MAPDPLAPPRPRSAVEISVGALDHRRFREKAVQIVERREGIELPFYLKCFPLACINLRTEIIWLTSPQSESMIRSRGAAP